MHCSSSRSSSYLALVLFVSIFLLPARLLALPTGVQEFYVLGFEEHIYSCLDVVDTGEYGTPGGISSNLVASVISFAISADDQVIIYDHWEDGHEADILEPVQSSTEIYGDGDLTNGTAPGTTDDRLHAGNVVILRSDGTGTGLNAYVRVNPRDPTAFRYDGNDRIVTAGGPINLTHATWPSDGTWIGGSWEIYPYQVYAESNSYRVPVGIDSYQRTIGGVTGNTGHFGDFKYVYLLVQATEDGTTIIVDNGQATNNRVTVSLDQGESWCSLGSVNMVQDTANWQLDVYEGTTITASAPIQAGIITASDGTFQSRYFLLFPESLFSTDYVVPFPSRGASETQIYVFNPNDQEITITAHDGPGGATYTFPVPENGAVPYSVITSGSYAPTTGGVRLSSDQVFWGIGSGDFSDTAYDWGFSLIPDTFVTSEVTAAWSPGSLNGANNWSPIWVSPLSDGTQFFVDLDGDGTFDAVDTDLDGIPNPGPYMADALDVFRFGDYTDNDNSGMRIEATGPFIAVWGPDPAVADGAGNIDWGNTVLPPGSNFISPGLSMTKTAEPKVVAITGGTVVYTLETSVGPIGPVTGIDVSDHLPSSEWTYVPGSAVITYPDLSTVQLDPTSSGNILTWDISHTLSAYETLIVTFEALYTPGTASGATPFLVTEGWESGGYAAAGGWSAPWTELADDGTATGGNVTVSALDGPRTGSRHLRFSGGGNGYVIGTVDLSSTQAPVLRYAWRTRSIDDGHYAAVWVSTNGGTSWTQLRYYGNGTDDNTYHLDSIDLSPYRQAGLQLAFGGYVADTNDFFYFDDIAIEDVAVGIAPAYGDYVNTGQANGFYRRFPLVSTDRDTVTTSFLELHKEASASSVVVSDVISYDLVLHNLSATADATNVHLRDLVPAHTSFVSLSATSGTTSYDGASNTATLDLASLPAGDSVTMTLAVRVKTVLFDGTLIRNVGRATCDEGIFTESNEVVSGVRIPVLELTASGPGTASEGEEITYGLSLGNTGSATASSVELIAPIPANATFLWNQATAGAQYSEYDTGNDWSYSPSQPDGTADGNVRRIRWVYPSFSATTTAATTFGVVLDSPLTPGTRIYEYARHDSLETNRGVSNIVVTVISPLTMAKSSDVTTGVPGQLVDYLFALENHDPTNTESSIVVTDTIPEGAWYVPGTAAGSGASLRYSTDNRLTWLSADPNDGLETTDPGYPILVTDLEWTLLSLNPATMTTLGFQVRIDNPLASGTTLRNRAEFISSDSASYGPLYSNRVAIPTIDLTLTHSASVTAAFPSEPVTFTFFYGNGGSSVAAGSIVTAAVPANMTVTSIEGGLSFSQSGGVITWQLGDLPPGAVGGVLRYTATVDAAAPAGSSFVSSGWASNSLDRQRSNTVTVLRASAGVSIGVDNSLWGNRGDTLYHPFSLVNTATATDSFTLSTVVHDWTTSVAVLHDADGDGVYDPALDTVISSLADVPPGGVRRLLLRITIPSSAADGSFNVSDLTARSQNDGSLVSTSHATTRLIVPLAVRLVEFRARRQAAGVTVEWSSSAEWSHAGYRLWRVVGDDGVFLPVGAFVVARGTPVLGARYEVFDPGVPRDVSPWYWLEEIDSHGRSRFHGPVSPDELLPSEKELTGEEAELPPPQIWESSVKNAEGWVEVQRDDSSVVIELRSGQCELRTRHVAGRNWLQARIPGYFHGRLDRVGWPALPLKGILVPLDGFDVLSAELLEEEGRDISFHGELLPAPRRIPDDTVPEGLRYEYSTAPESLTGIHPTEGAFSFVGLRHVGRKTHAFCRFHPLRSLGEAGRLRFSERIRVRLNLRRKVDGVVQAAAATVDPLVGSALRIECRGEGWVWLTGADLMTKGLPPSSSSASLELLHGGELRLLRIEDGGDGIIESGDRVGFWAEAHSDKYTDRSPHFLRWSASGASPMETRAASSTTPAIEAAYHWCEYLHEKDEFYWMLQPGPDEMDRWFFSAAIVPGTMNLSWSVPGALAEQGGAVELQARFLPMMSSNAVDPDHHLRLRCNGSSLADETWDGLEEKIVTGSFVPSSGWNGTCSLDVETILPDGVAFDRHLLDWVRIRYRAAFVAENDRLTFENGAGAHRYHVRGFTRSDVRLLDVTPGQAVRWLENLEVLPELDGTFTLLFEDEVTTTHRYHAFSGAASSPLASLESVTLDGAISQPPQGELLVIAPESLQDAVAPLIARRRASGLSVLLRSPRWFQDEFDHGFAGPRAIREGLRALAQGGTLRWVLLAGDASSDPRGRLGAVPAGTVPTWLVYTPFAGETASDHHHVLLDGDEFPDLALGRLPARDGAAMRVMVSKILAYEDGEAGDWNRRVLGLSGSGEPDFEALSEDCFALVPSGWSLGSIHANDYVDVNRLKSDVETSLETGAFLVHYVGHGLVNQWDQEDILPPATISSLANGAHLPMVLSATCFDAYHLDPSGGASRVDSLLTAPAGGAVACFSSTGMSKTEAKDPLMRAFYEKLFQGDTMRVGDLVQQAKVSYLSNGDDPEQVVGTHSLFGDPSMLLSSPIPAAPGNLRVRLLGGASVELSWDAPDGGLVSGYVVERQAGAASGMIRCTAQTLVGLSYVDQVDSGIVYGYQVRAVGPGGTLGPASNLVTALVILPADDGDGGTTSGGGGGCSMNAQSGSGDPSSLLWLLLGLTLLLLRRKMVELPTSD